MIGSGCRLHPSLSFVLLVITFLLSVTTSSSSHDDLYKILGVARSATTKDIKAAYRRKARDTHPDKNQGVDPDVAAEAFRKVVHAFEILSDDNSRRRYDRTGYSGSAESMNNGGNGASGGGGSRFHHQWTWSSRTRQRRPQQMKDRADVKKAQSRVMHVVSMAQLETVMLDDEGLLERNLLICFVTPMDVERIADEQVVFPFPFAGMSEQQIWWEDILQTVKVRYHRENDLSKHFGMPTGDEMRRDGMPAFVFVKRGDPLTKYETIRTSTHKEFFAWVWKQLEVDVEFRNEHQHPVELYWISKTSGRLKATIEPGESFYSTTMLSHEWIARDARVDKFEGARRVGSLSENTWLGRWKILSDVEHKILVIPNTSCYDLSGHCSYYKRIAGGEAECNRNPAFMLEYCAKTCNACNESDTSARDEL